MDQIRAYIDSIVKKNSSQGLSRGDILEELEKSDKDNLYLLLQSTELVLKEMEREEKGNEEYIKELKYIIQLIGDLIIADIYTSGQRLAQNGEYAKAIEEYTKAIAKVPNSRQVNYDMGISLSALGRYEESISWYDKAINIDPEYYFSYLDKGFSLQYTKKYLEAIDCFTKVLEINPQCIPARNSLMAIYYMQEDKEELYTIAQILSKGGYHEDAIVIYEEIIKKDSSYMQAYYDIGISLSALGKYEESINRYNKAISIDPFYIHNYYDKGLSLLKINKPKQAYACFEKTIELNENFEQSKIELERLDKELGNDFFLGDLSVPTEKLKALLNNPQAQIGDVVIDPESKKDFIVSKKDRPDPTKGRNYTFFDLYQTLLLLKGDKKEEEIVTSPYTLLSYRITKEALESFKLWEQSKKTLEDSKGQNEKGLHTEFNRLYRDSYGPIIDGHTFNPQEVKNISFQDIRNKYISEHIGSLNEGSKGQIKSISEDIVKQNNGKINTKNTVVVPIYIKEDIKELEKLINTIQEQKGDFKVIFYVNGYNKDLDNEGNIKKENVSTKDEFDKKVESIKALVHNKEKFIITGNYYDRRTRMGSIRADIMDSMILSYDEKAKEPNIILLDADTRKLENGYIETVEKTLSDPGTIYCGGKLRDTTTAGVDHKFIRFNEILSRLGFGDHTVVKGSLDDLSGQSANVRLSDYLKVKGFDREIHRGEDTGLTLKLQWFYGKKWAKNKHVGQVFNKKVRTDPRRNAEAIRQEKFYHQANSIGMNHIGKNTLDDRMQKYNDIIARLLDNIDISIEELQEVEDYIDHFCNEIEKQIGNSTVRQNILNKLPVFRNKTEVARNSSYKMEVEDGKIRFIKKT